MKQERVELPRPIVNQIFHVVQATPEQEVCGLIGAQENIPIRCYPVPNIAEQSERQFLMEAASQIEAMRQMRKHAESLFAIYHSHPGTAAEPSATDRALADYPDTLYLIISLNTKGVLEMRGFRIRADQSVDEVELVLADE